jgi:hypothetical protein
MATAGWLFSCMQLTAVGTAVGAGVGTFKYRIQSVSINVSQQCQGNVKVSAHTKGMLWAGSVDVCNSQQWALV